MENDHHVSEIVMTLRHRPAHAIILKIVVTTLLSEGVDLKTVTLEDVKERLRQAILSLSQNSKSAAI